MKKIVAIIVAVLFVFTLSSCTTEEKEITIIVYSETPQDTVSNLEDLPELLAVELQALGYEFTRVVLQASDDMSLMESSVNNGLVDIAVLDPTMLTTTSLIRVLDVAMDEMNHPDGNEDATTYEYAIVVSATTAGEAYRAMYEETASVDITALEVCAVSEEEEYITEFADTTINDLLNFTSSSSKQELYESLEDGACDLGVVKLEEVSDYSGVWDDNENTIYEELSVIYVFEPIQYEGFYVSSDAEELLVNSLIQSFIQLSAHSTNRELFVAMGHDYYKVPTE